MRLFAALVPPPVALDELAAAVVAARGRRDGLRWTSREEWHVTLLFLGEVPDEGVDAVRAGLARATARHRAMTLGLSGAGTFPEDPARAHVLWADLAGDVPALTSLAAELRGAAVAAGIGVEDRAYTPHLTLARSRRAADLSALRAELDVLDTERWRATEVRLVHSRREGAPRYRTVDTWALT